MSDNSKNNTPVIIIVICASITMLVQTISSAITVMGYDEVIRADAKARAGKILQSETNQKLIEQINENSELIRELTLDNEVLKEYSHKPKG